MENLNPANTLRIKFAVSQTDDSDAINFMNFLSNLMNILEERSVNNSTTCETQIKIFICTNRELFQE